MTGGVRYHSRFGIVNRAGAEESSMRRALTVVVLAMLSIPLAAQRVGTMSELMIKVIYPTSDAVFYISTRTPESQEQWNELQGKTLMLAESANVLMMTGYARDQDQWMADAKLMREAGAAAFRAAKAKDVAALEGVSDQLYESCTTCHRHYRPNYGRGATVPDPR
jgi:hypothetical protein